MKRSICQSLSSDIKFGEPCDNNSPTNPEFYKSDQFAGYSNVPLKESKMNHQYDCDKSKTVSPINPSEYYKPEEFFGYIQPKDKVNNIDREEPLNIGMALNTTANQYNSVNVRDTLKIHLVNSKDPSKRASLTLSAEQIENICRESEFFANLVKENTFSPPMSPMRAASPLASSMRGASPSIRYPSPSMRHSSPMKQPPYSPKGHSYNNNPSYDGVTIFEDNLNEAIYLLGIMSDLCPNSDISVLPWKLNIIWARLCAKWKAARFIEYFTKLMDRELLKIIDTRSCDIVMVSGENECVFTPHPKKPNSYLSRKATKVSSIELVSLVNNSGENIVTICWELTICLRKPDGTVAVGRMNFPCKSDTLLQDCSGVWDGHPLRFRLGKRHEKYTKAFISISELIIEYECYQHGEILHNKHEIKKLLCSHPELWTSDVFDKLFTKDELTEFMLLNCGPR